MKEIERVAGDEHFTVAIFGSARIKESDPLFEEVRGLSKQLAAQGIDVVTGGGPGLMQAANQGHRQAMSGGHSIGLRIRLSFEQRPNEHLDVKKDFERFSGRLDHFMSLANAVVVAPGGIGTLLELFYTWQLEQVKHICHIPIILYGEMWPGLIGWMRENVVDRGFAGEQDLQLVYHAKDRGEVMKIIDNAHAAFRKGGKNFCLNYKKYRIM